LPILERIRIPKKLNSIIVTLTGDITNCLQNGMHQKQHSCGDIV